MVPAARRAAPTRAGSRGHLLEPDPVLPGGAGDVQVAVDHGGGVVGAVPVGGRRRPAPLRELRVAQHARGLAGQREVVDQDRRQGAVADRQPFPGVGQPGPAPGLAAGVRVGVQQGLVGAHHAGLVGHRERGLLGRRALGPERVVVEQEQRRDGHRPARPRPYREGVLGGDHAQAPAQLDQVPVAGLAAQPDRVSRVSPQLVVAGHPDDLGEPLAQRAQCPLDMRHDLAHVAGHQQPVARRARPQGGHDLPVGGEGHVQVADGQQPGPGAVRRSAVRLSSIRLSRRHRRPRPAAARSR